jgi:hypothetical protein
VRAVEKASDGDNEAVQHTIERIKV